MKLWSVLALSLLISHIKRRWKISDIFFCLFSLTQSILQKALNGRFYGGRTISAETYDGVTKFDVQETEEELQKRLDDWEKFIGGDDEDDDDDVANKSDGSKVDVTNENDVTTKNDVGKDEANEKET